MDAQRALLDDLLGAGRNLNEEERRGFNEIEWYDIRVCAYYLIRFCPHDLFVNTRSDLGACSRIHDPKLKESFEKSSKHDSYVPIFEDELVKFCEKLVNDLDDKFKLGRERLALDIQPSLSVLEKEIKKFLEQVEALGEEGKVDEAEALMKKVEELNTEKTVLLQRSNDKLALCEVCGSFLVSNDSAERTRYHVTGKQHVGFGMVRDFLAEQKAAKGRGKEADDKRKPREKETESGRYRDRDRDKDGDRHRDRGRDHIKPYDNKPWRRRSRSRSPHGRSSHRRVSRS